MRRILHPFRRVTAQASRNSAHDGEGEGKRGLGIGFHRVNYTIFAALRVGFRGRFPWPRKVSVVRREQIRVLIKTAPLPVHPRCGRPLVGGYAQTAAQTAAAFQLFNLSTAAQTAAGTVPTTNPNTGILATLLNSVNPRIGPCTIFAVPQSANKDIYDQA